MVFTGVILKNSGFNAVCILFIAWVYHYLARNPVECDLREGARVGIPSFLFIIPVYYLVFRILPGRIYIITYGVQKPGPQYSPAIVVYTLHSIVMVLLYYIYLYLFYTKIF